MNTLSITPNHLAVCSALQTGLLAEMKREFVGKDEVIDLLGVSLIGGENLFILGPPGTAKSALVHRLCQYLRGDTFIYLLTRFTEPNELFGPFDIRRLREGELTTNTNGMLTEASLVFLDELLNANSAILNSLLTALNEKSVHRGHERIPVQALLFVGASNHLPQEDALQALFDRFLLRVHCDNVPTESLPELLEAGWRFERNRAASNELITFADIRQLQALLPLVSLDEIRQDYADLIRRIRQAGIRLSDRRAVKLQRVIAASALLCGRPEANLSDLWVLRYIWDNQEQQELLKALVQEVVERALSPEVQGDAPTHEQASVNSAPDPERLAADLAALTEQLKSEQTPISHGILRDRLATLASRLPWVQNADQREFLEKQVNLLWQQLDPDGDGRST